jgi:serine/threonine protein kinase
MRALRPGDPTQIGGYQLRAHLGSGGMGTVYLASTPGGRLVALKSIRPELIADDEFQARFRLEVRAARQVRGLYTAELLDADPDAIPPWLVTSYVPGPSLDQALKEQGPVPLELVPLLMAGVAEALLDIHAAGIVHRDLKPSNVLLSPDGPRVIDFGIARALDESRLTISGVTMGSPECMTPEQVRGLPVTPAADVFSLGSLGVYAASGRSPFAAPNSAAMMYRVVHEDPVLDAFPAGTRELLERCFSKDPGDRPSPTEVLQACQALIPEQLAVFPQSWEPEPGGTPDFGRPHQLTSAGDARSASGPMPPPLASPARGTAPPKPGKAWDSPAKGWGSPAKGLGSPAKGWVTGARRSPDLAPLRTQSAPSEPALKPRPALKQRLAPKLRPALKPRSAPKPRRARPRRPTVAWLMYGAAAIAVAALAVGLVTLPSLRPALGRQQVPAAVGLAAAVIVVRALTSAAMWLLAALATTRGHPRARAARYAALAVSALDLVSSLLGLSTAAGQDLMLAGLAAGLAAVTAGGLPRLPAAAASGPRRSLR